MSKLLSEFFGTMFLVMIVIGSGIMAENLSGGNVALALLANSLATGAGLIVLIYTLSDISGAHFNPVVTLIEHLNRKINLSSFFKYILAQFSGAYIGIIITHLMFNIELVQISTHERIGFHLWVSEIVATFGLISTILLLSKKKSDIIPLAVGLYIMSAYWFTSSTSFANPAVTFARMFTNTFGGSAPNGFIQFLIAQSIGSFLAFFTIKKLHSSN